MSNQKLDAVKRALYETELADSQSAEHRNALLLKLGFVLTFLLYLIFNQHLYLGDATGWGEYLKDGASMAGFAFLMTITVLMALFLAGVKHHLYLHFGVVGQVAYVVVLLIGFALLAEMFSTSASQDVKSRIMLSKDDAYQQTLQSNQAPANLGSNELTGQLAAARRKLAQCRERLAQKREPHCKGSAATLHSLMESERKLIEAQKQVSVEGQKLNHHRQDKLKAESYNPVVVTTAKMLAGAFGGEYGDFVKQAIMVLMMLVAITFEVLHHFLSTVHGETKRRINEMSLQLATMEDRKQQDYSPALDPESQQSFGFVKPDNQSPATVQSRFKYQDKQPLKTDLEPPAKQPFGFSPSPKSELPDKAITGRTGKHNPVLGRAEQHYELPLDKPLANGVQTGFSEPESTDTALDIKTGSDDHSETVRRPLANGSKGLYEDWIQAVNDGGCKPSVKPTWTWIQKRIAGSENGSRTHDRTRISAMQKAFFSRAIADGYMMLNPSYKNGAKKFLWITQPNKSEQLT